MKKNKFELRKIDDRSWAVFKKEYLEYWDELEIIKLEKAWQREMEKEAIKKLVDSLEIPELPDDYSAIEDKDNKDKKE